MGHADIHITINRYGHLMPGNGAEAAELLDAYRLAAREREAARAREAVVPGDRFPRPIAPFRHPYGG